MAKKRTTTGQTSTRMITDVLKKHYASTLDTAAGYSTLKNSRLSASVIVYTITNLIETGIITKTDDDRHHSVEKNWNKVMHKVSPVCVILLGFPIIILLIFLGIQMLMS